MKQLSVYIESLLLSHDCVVLPRVGAFITKCIPARYDDRDKLFLPPIRTVSFNSQLRTDDGLLTAAIAKANACSYAQAASILSGYISSMQHQLWQQSCCELGSVGTFCLNEDGELHFTAMQAGTVCPMYYGLDALPLPPLVSATAPVAEAVAPAPRIQRHKGEITIRLKKTWLQYVATVAAVVLLFLGLAPEAKNTVPDGAMQAEFLQLALPQLAEQRTEDPVEMNTATTDEDAVVQEPETTALDPAAAETEAEVAPAQTTTAAPAAMERTARVQAQPAATSKAQASDEPTGYCVVVASAITLKNAKEYVTTLHKAGYSGARVYAKGKMVRVIFAGYDTYEAAHREKNRLTSASTRFTGAWVYALP